MRSRKFVISLFTICLLVMTQLAVAAYACMQPAQIEPVSSVSMSTFNWMQGMPDCDSQTMVQQQEPLCKAHCQKDDQSADSRTPNLPPPLFLLAYVFAPMLSQSEPQPQRFDLASASLDHYARPLRIQYQVFRN
ncbi:hypothetical protein NT239_03500 [Chitinibacter sp. SCUT-21]|uniref:hypothetical protein n=2 Tax=unclassified Chitinibacter TaxID=2619399 RepID=UPI0035A61714